MNILYFGSACDKEWFDKASEIKKMPSYVAQYRFEMALLNGFSSFEEVDMDIYYMFQEPYYPKGYLRFKSKVKQLNFKYKVKYISNLNIPIFKEINYFFQGLMITLKWGLKNRKNKNKVIFTPFNYTPLSLGIFIASKITRIKRLNVFTDLSSDIINKERQENMILLKRILLPLYIKFVNFVEKNFDIYVLFTESMNSMVNTKNKPFVVMEGIFYNDFDLSPVAKTKSVMYAGTLSYEYGVGNIIDAFIEISDTNLELWLFGDGNMKNHIEELSITNKNIHFFGFKSQKEVFNYEKMATLLINIRDPQDLYTKYSFPSKTFEYMVSGTPFLTTKLIGIPSEYYDYMYTVDSYITSEVKKKIIEILNKPQVELDEFGEIARGFIIENKNPKMQLKKIIDLLNENI